MDSRGRPFKVTDDDIRETIQKNQLKKQQERGTDITIFSPRAAGMGHHIGDFKTSLEWSRASNEMIYRVTELFPKNFIGVAQLPQSPGVDPKTIDSRNRALRERNTASSASTSIPIRRAATGMRRR